MEQLSAIAAALTFLVSFDRLQVPREARRAVRAGQEATLALRDPTNSDTEKERLARASSISLLGAFLSIALKGGIALLSATAVLFAFQLLGLGTVEASARWLMSWPVLLGLTVSVIAVSMLRSRG